ncbi:hypothetical protein E7T06_01865 [Deinococcus sp. Arct2-2]|uniref:hypothetical protein n=1 Tax=Deinococcus sp. Arct2-2 TaxID=2568653 RepID=UPI0010A33475|nr:hypothetical protein [Deinococcus sp. Arct2-2]THF71726.1 hypothetical protein E7T06_01865 [Deinococcus sp. Arct2-2]
MTFFEFLICEANGGLFEYNFAKGEFAAALQISSQPAQVVSGQGMHCLKLRGFEIEMNDELPGVQVVFSGDLEHQIAVDLTHELAESLSRFTGQPAAVIDFNGELKGKIVSF